MKKFKISQVDYTEIPFLFKINNTPNHYQSLGSDKSDVDFSIVLRKINHEIEAALKFTHRNVNVNSEIGNKIGTRELHKLAGFLNKLLMST